MYRLATTHFVTDRRTDGQTDSIMIAVGDHTVWQYDRLKTEPAVIKSLASFDGLPSPLLGRF